MRSGLRAAAFAALAVALAGPPLAAQPVQGGPLPGPLPLFPADNWWNVDVSAAPVDPNSAAFIPFIGPTRDSTPTSAATPSPRPAIYGMPYVVVPGTQPLEPVAFDYADESDTGAPGRPAGYPIPVEAKTQTKWIEGGYAGQLRGVRRRQAHAHRRPRQPAPLRDVEHALPPGGLAVVLVEGRLGGGLPPRLERSGAPTAGRAPTRPASRSCPASSATTRRTAPTPIRHAFRVTVRDTNGYVFPASHVAGARTGAPPMGTRLRLKASKDISGFPAPVQRIFQAMKTYGLIVADNGSDMYVQGTYDTRWDNDVLNPAFATSTRATSRSSSSAGSRPRRRSRRLSTSSRPAASWTRGSPGRRRPDASGPAR